MGGILSSALSTDSPETSSLVLIEEILPFDNLSKSEIEALWRSFYENAASFATTRQDLVNIFVGVAVRFGSSPAQMAKDTRALFDAFIGYSDEHRVVDIMEILMAIVFISDITVENKIRLVFDAADMSEDGRLDIDEFTISLKSTLSGLAKIISSQKPIDENEIEDLAEDIFREIIAMQDPKLSNNVSISCEQFTRYCQTNEQVKNIFNEFCTAEGSPIDPDLELEGSHPERTPQQTAAMDPEEREAFDDMLDSHGDEFMAVKPWLGAIVSPTNPPRSYPEAPSADVQLKWIHGFRGQDMRNHARYTKHGDIVYPAAAVGVIRSLDEMKQRHFVSHTDDITSLDLNPDGTIVATGECGKIPKIIIWDTSSLESLTSIRGFHKRSIALLRFSCDGKQLVSVGGDDDHSIAIYTTNDKWTTSELLCSAKGNREKPLGIAFNPVSAAFAVCGVKYMELWTVEKNKIQSTKAIVGKKGKIQPFIAVEYWSDRIVVGTTCGDLYLFKGRNLDKTVKAHESSVYALSRSQKCLVSGGKDGKVIVWDKNFKKIAGPFDLLKSYPLMNASVRSACLSADERRLLIGTQGSEIVEICAMTGDSLSPSPLAVGHFKDELWGLSAHPKKLEFCTVGDDRTLRIWDIESNKQLRAIKIDSMTRACAYSPDGSKIAIGLGGRVGRGKGKKDGGFAVFNEGDLSKIHEGRDSKKWISDVKFSPDGKLLAIGGHDTNIILYDIQRNYKKVRVFKSHASYITHFDFSRDSTYLQSNCGAYEYLFSNSTTGKQVTSATSLKDTDWDSWTCTLGWPVQGIWPPSADGTDINAVDRSHDHRLLATADDFGKVKLFRYPCVEKSAQFIELRGHSSHVTNIRWSFDDRYMISAGGNDRCIFVWEVQAENDTTISLNKADAAEETPEATIELSEVQFELDSGGDEFMAIKPWLGAIVAPSNPATHDGTAPDIDVELDWVHGYQAQNSRNNCRYTSTGQVVYHAAAVGIAYDPSGKLQHYYMGHDDDIVSLAIHPDGVHVATGQLGKKPTIQIWKTSADGSISSEITIGGCHKRAVPVLCFSDSGEQLASVGADDDHSFSLHRWQDGALLATGKGEKSKVLDMCYNPNTSGWVTCGAKHIRFWKIQGRNVSATKGILGKLGKIQIFLCVVCFGENIVVGTQGGEIYLFGSHHLTKKIAAHEKAVNSLYCTKAESNKMISGGADGRVIVWDRSFSKLSSFDVCSDKFKSLNLVVQSVCFSSDGQTILVGTKGSEIVEYNNNGSMAKIITQAHYKDELWGIAFHPSGDEYCTVGDDKTLRLWNVKSREQVKVRELDSMARACCYSPDGSILAVGLGGRVGRGKQKKDGAIIVLKSESLQVLFEDRPSKQWISDIKFSPAGDTLAVGSHDNKIYFYKSKDGKFKRMGNFNKHNSYITHFDFAANGQAMQSNCGAYELLFCNPNNGQHITSATSLKDTTWETWTCTLGWPVQGIWPPFSDGTDINAVARSNNFQMLATADDFGKLKLFRYPCTSKDCQSLEYKGHSSHVTNVRWSPNDDYLITLGGNDRCIFQWRNQIEESEPAPPISLPEEGDNAEDFDLESGGDEFMAIKPWLGAIVAPSNPPAENLRPPDVGLELEWVHGYQCVASRNNVRYSASGSLIYNAAALGVIMDTDLHTQTYHRGHTDDVVSLDVSADGRFAVTGELGKKPTARVWDAETGEVCSELSGCHTRGVILCTFSKCGKYICTVGNDDDHSIAVWIDEGGSWSVPKLLTKSKGDRAKTLFACFIGKDNSCIVTGGLKFVKFWTLQGKNMIGKKGQFGKLGSIQPIVCGTPFTDASLVTGAADGSLYLWANHKVSKAIKAHNGGIDSVFSSGNILVSGGRDGKICSWDSDLSQISCFSIPGTSLDAAVRSIAMNSDSSRLVAGTRGGEIYELNIIDGSNIGDGPRIHSHNKYEVWGLAVHPDNRTYCTVGDDKTLRIWDAEAKLLVKVAKLECKARSCAYSPNGELIAVGLGGDVGRGKQRLDGAIRIYNESDLTVLFEDRPSKQWISDVKFSPTGDLVAFGSHDNRIYLYDVTNTAAIKKHATFKKHNSYITHMDFSADGQVLQSNCGAYEYLFSDTSSGRQITSASSLRDTEWSSWTCTLGWPVQGIWPECADGTDINAVDASPSRQLLATSDDMGKVKLFRYPCITAGAKYVSGEGHCSHVTNVRFTPDEVRCITTGGNDRCVFQWRITS